MKDWTNLINQSSGFVTQLIINNLSDNYCYHNLRHTEEVVLQTQFLCHEENIAENDVQRITIAAWFHDTGFINDYLNHERESMIVAREFLQEKNVEESDIQFITDCIWATELHSEKKTIAQKILSDADCFHFGLPNFMARSICLKHEWEMVRKVNLSLKQLLAGSIIFLEQHQFYTQYGINVLEIGKQNNLQYMMHLEEILENNNY
ncbi:MAG: HD domain-containing protein [Bacteroidales bacterium]|nr:HD domain-containing protein [Bacteroidales bacterium]